MGGETRRGIKPLQFLQTLVNLCRPGIRTAVARIINPMSEQPHYLLTESILQSNKSNYILRVERKQ